MSMGSYKEVILRQKVKKLGDQGDIIRVKSGYARNFLIPRGFALEATPENRQKIQIRNQQIENREKKEQAEVRKIAEKLSKLSLTASVQVGEEDRIFGSVTAMTLSNLLKEQGFEIDKKDIVLTEPIKALGLYNIAIKLQADMQVDIKVYVIKE